MNRTSKRACECFLTRGKKLVSKRGYSLFVDTGMAAMELYELHCFGARRLAVHKKQYLLEDLMDLTFI